jgi:hypothetical protein
MTPKKTKMHLKKLQRIQDQENIDIDLNDACKQFFDIERYFRLRQGFILKFELRTLYLR